MIDIPDFVYPKDEQGNALCPRCKKTLESCHCPSGEPEKKKSPKVIPKITLDKSGRKGKVVTLVEGLPRIEAYLKDMSKKLKTKTGSGGTFYIANGFGVIEIQGDHKKTVTDAFNFGHFNN